MTVTSEPEVYYDPYDFDIDADPVPGVEAAARRGAAVLEREVRVLRAEPLGRRRRGHARLEDLHLGPGLGPRDHQGQHRDPARIDPLRGPAHPRPPPWPALPGLHAQEDAGARAPGARLLRARCSTRSSVRVGSTSSRTWASSCRCGSSACCSGIPEEDQVAIRDRLDDSLRLEEGVAPETDYDALGPGRGVLRLHHLARRAPLRRPDDRAAQRRVRGRSGHDTHADPRRDPHLRRSAGRGRERDHDPPDRLHRRGPGPPPGPARRAGGGPVARSTTPSRSCCATRRPRPCSPAT